MSEITYDLSPLYYTCDELIALRDQEIAQFDAWSDVLAMSRTHKRRAEASESAMRALDLADQCTREIERRAA